jgi:hypothetical protein
MSFDVFNFRIIVNTVALKAEMASSLLQYTHESPHSEVIYAKQKVMDS